ncbi:MAG: response regulator [Gammaproteobacteria bacterium]|nr:response regulator [Gammaproteobacteria bacterium]MCW8993590.1 response regulator [Gammaproteobacteria bacterium]
MARKILLVEDQKSVAAMTGRMLNDAGYQYRHAHNGQEAIELLRNGVRPDLILLDIVMPVMGGYEFLDELNGNEALRELPVIMLTGLGEATAVLNAVRRGAVDYLTKPVEPEVLLACIGRVLAVKESESANG